MRWSINVGKVFGIRFRIHVTFLLLLLFVFASGLSQRGPEDAVRAVLFICAVFLCVVIHELGHSLISRVFGKEVESITLLPIGGLATVEEMPEKPSQEIAMSIIGPFINLAIAGVLYVFIGRQSGIKIASLYPTSASEFFGGLMSVNIMLAAFNLIPAFPMDGGRVLRGLLAMKMDYVKATSVAVSVGQGLSMVMMFFGIFFNLWLALIGFFLYVGAGNEKQSVVLKSALHQITAREVMATDFRSMQPHDLLAQSLEHVYHGCQDDFPVVGSGGVEGILTRNNILAAIHDRGLDVPVSEAMDRDFASFSPGARLDDVYRQMISKRKTGGAVLDGGKLLGILCLENISRYLMIQAALKGVREPILLSPTKTATG